MLIQLVDPAAYTPPYDHALATALARAGARVELVTTSSPDWDAAMQATTPSWAAATTTAGQSTYARHLDFYGRSSVLPGRLRQLGRAAEHPVGLMRLRRRPADLTHVQWAPLQELDRWGLPTDRPLVITAHDVLPREARPGQRAAQRAIYARADLVIAHSRHGRDRLVAEAGVEADRIRVIPHGAFTHLAEAARDPLPAELADWAARPESERPPVVLSFGLIRPYKATDDLLRAWQQVPGDAELWIVGRPRGVDLRELHALADHRVRFVSRFVTDGELAACFDAAQVAVLPYREIEQSGVLATAVAFGVPTVATAVGAFPEAAELGAVSTVPPSDEAALAGEIARLLESESARRALAAGAAHVTAGPWSWPVVAKAHLAAYGELLGAAEADA